MRSKRMALIIAVVFALSIMLPMAAFAGDTFTVTSAVKQKVLADEATDLGWFKVTVKEEVYVPGGKIYLDVDLPSDVEFINGDTSRSVTVTAATYTFYFADTVGNAVYVGENAADDIYVDVTARYVDENDNLIGEFKGAVLVATKGDGALAIEVGDLPTLSAGQDKKIADITITENFAGVAVGDAVYLELPAGFKWEADDNGNAQKGTVSGKYGLETGVTLTVSGDDSELLTIAGFGDSSPFGGEVTIEDLEITVYPNAPLGDLEVRVWCSDSDLMADTNVVVAHIGEAAVAVSVEENARAGTPYVGSVNVALDTIKLESDSAFGSDATVVVELPEGVEFEDVADVAVTGGSPIDLFNDNQSAWIGLDANATEATITPTVRVTADAEIGDLTVVVSGAASGSVVLGEVEPRISVSADKPEITIGLGRAAGDITIVETGKDSIADVNGAVYLELPSGVEFASAPTVEVNGEGITGDVDIADPKKAIFSLNGTLSGTRVDTIVVSDVELDLDSRVATGDVVVKIYGGAVNAETSGEAVAEVAIATVVDEAVVTTSFTAGDEGVTIVNGRTLVQVNLLCDILGLQKSWDSATKTAYFVKGGKIVAFPMGENAIYINGVKVPVDQGGMIINDYTYATLRGLQMAFDGELEWDDATKTATFTFTK
jgi:hypothetical protein